MADIDWLIAELQSGRCDLQKAELTRDVVCDGDTASRILAAAASNCTRSHLIVWAGTVTSDWSYTGGPLGDVFLVGNVLGDLNLSTRVSGNLILDGFVWGNASLQDPGCVLGSFFIFAEIRGDFDIWSRVEIGNDLDFRGYVGGDIGLSDEVSIGGSLLVSAQASVGNDLVVSGQISGDVVVQPPVDHVDIAAKVGGATKLPEGGQMPASFSLGSGLNLGW